MIRVLIVDDHVLFREGVVALLRGRPTVQVVASVGSGEQAMEACRVHAPQVVLMDQHMPAMDGAECTRRLRELFPDLHVLALTTFDDDATVFSALRSGAVGYLLKDAEPEALVGAIEAAARGQSVVDPAVLSRVLAEFERLGDGADAPSRELAQLSERELAVLRVLSLGRSNKEIASALHIAEGTVKNHVTSIFEKLGVSDRTSAALRARELGI